MRYNGKINHYLLISNMKDSSPHTCYLLIYQYIYRQDNDQDIIEFSIPLSVLYPASITRQILVCGGLIDNTVNSTLYLTPSVSNVEGSSAPFRSFWGFPLIEGRVHSSFYGHINT